MKFLKVAVVIILTLVFADIGEHIIYRFRDGKWLWQQRPIEVFSIRSFTEFVTDDRIITNRRSIFNREYRFGFDKDRFRIGLNDYSEKSPNIIFLGDSVPFGWGVEWDQSIPSQFFTLLRRSPYKEYGVINAAVPSYSLHQSLARYKEEIRGKFPVALVILQIYDPANQLAEYGEQWSTKIATVDPRKTAIYKLGQNPFDRYSSLVHTALNVFVALSKGKPLDIHDTKTKEYFLRTNERDLSALLDLVKEDKASLVLLPVNPAASYKQQLQSGSTDPNVHAIDWLNTLFRDFAQSHKGAYFFDVVDFFDGEGREGNFLDACCHLSATGSTLQARFLFDQLKENRLLR